jgi:hypothetical protein
MEAAIAAEQLSRARRDAFFNESAIREADRRASGRESFREIQRADYVAGGGRAYTPKAGLPSYGFGPKAASEAERAAATAYRGENQRRLDAGDSLLPAAVDRGDFAFDPKLLKAGKLENIAGWLAPGLTAVGAATRPDPYGDLDASQRRTVFEALKRYGLDPYADPNEAERG